MAYNCAIMWCIMGDVRVLGNARAEKDLGDFFWQAAESWQHLAYSEGGYMSQAHSTRRFMGCVGSENTDNLLKKHLKLLFYQQAQTILRKKTPFE